MKTKWMVLPIVAAAALAPAAALADVEPLVVPALSGNLHIDQPLPGTCDNVDLTTDVTGGRLQIVPGNGAIMVGSFRVWVLTQATASIAPFRIHRDCMGENKTMDYTQLDVEIGHSATVVGLPAGASAFDVAISKDDVLLVEAAVVNGNTERSYVHPKEDVTGHIDLAQGTIELVVRLASKVHVPVLGDYDGTLTATLTGTFAADTDGDGVPDASDNCRLVPNSGQGPVATPLLRPPPPVTVATCLATQLGTPLATDVCDGGAVAVTDNAPSPLPRGSTVVTWTGTDGKGRVATGTQTVTVVDTTPPVFTSLPPDITMTDCGPANLGLPTATDDCAGVPTFTNDAPAKFLAGPTVVHWTATDVSGNHATATQTVTVNDMVPPEVSCGPGSNPAGHGHGGGGFFRVSATDHCTASPALRLGGFALTIGETIKITETGQPGVRLVNDMGPGGVRHFQVGRGEAVITATDGSGNNATAACR
jgi:hypothetical protein